MHERFSDRARRAMALANQEAIRLHHDYLAPVHILLGILSMDTSVAAMVLRNLDIDLETLRNDAHRLIKPGDKEIHQTKMAQRADTRQAIQFAIEEARKLGHKYVGTEHLLLGVLREGTNIPARLFGERGVKIERLRDEILKLLGSRTDEDHVAAATGHDSHEWLHQQELAKAFRSPRFWHRLVYAVEEANRLGQGEIEDEHLLLALLREPDSFVARMLREKEVTPDWVRERIARGAP